MTDFHVQCSLEKRTGEHAIARMVTWIPQEYARKDSCIQLKGEDDSWEDGWKVVGVHDRMELKYVLERAQDHKKTRKASDI